MQDHNKWNMLKRTSWGSPYPFCMPFQFMHLSSWTKIPYIRNPGYLFKHITEYVSHIQYSKNPYVTFFICIIVYIRISASSSQDSCGVIIFNWKNSTRASANSWDTHISSNIPHLNRSIMCSSENTFTWYHLDTANLHNIFECTWWNS